MCWLVWWLLYVGLSGLEGQTHNPNSLGVKMTTTTTTTQKTNPSAAVIDLFPAATFDVSEDVTNLFFFTDSGVVVAEYHRPTASVLVHYWASEEDAIIMGWRP